MKENYKPWEIKVEDFFGLKSLNDQLQFLINFAVLAPSSHNSQPWKYEVKNDCVYVSADRSRELKVSDENGRQLFISLGCAIENIIVAGDYYGFVSAVEYLPDTSNEDLAAKISLRFAPPKDLKSSIKNHLIFSIRKRVTNRNAYENRMPAEPFLKEIVSLGGRDFRIDFIREEIEKNLVADIALDAMMTAMTVDEFRYELSNYIKSNITKHKIGMPGFGMGFPTLISFVAPHMLRRFNMAKATKKKDEALLKKSTPLFAVISTKDDDRNSWLRAGEAYEKIALLAEREGLATAVWAAPIQIGEFYKNVQKIIKTDFRPQVFFRIGYAKKPTRHSPRLSAIEVNIYINA